MLGTYPMTTRGRTTNRNVPPWALALKLRRVQLGLSQEGIADVTDGVVSQSTVSSLEVGKQQLGDLAYTRVVALARALNWTLPEMQAATGVDLGVTTMEPIGNEALPVFRLQDLLKPDPQPDAFSFVPPNPKVRDPENYGVFLADSDEMTTAQARSIHQGDMVFLDLGSTTPEEQRVYAIESGGRVLLRRLTSTPFGLAWTADNPAYAAHLIPADQARVLGRLYRIVSDRPDTPLN